MTNLNIKETNVILQSLAKQPFEISAAIIDVIKNQAKEQLPEEESISAEMVVSYEFKIEELQLILNSLAKQPYELVVDLIYKIIEQNKEDATDAE